MASAGGRLYRGNRMSAGFWQSGGKVLEVLNDISADSGVGKHQATTICQDGEEKLFLKGKLICKIHRTKQRELEKFNLQSFFYYYFSNMTKEFQFQCC